MMDPGIQRHEAPAALNDDRSVREMFPVVYDELRALARHWGRHDTRAQSLQPTAIVHEAYLRLINNSHLEWTDRDHFFAIAANAMRNIILDHARNRRARKRGGDWQRVTLTESIPVNDDRDFDALALFEALERLESRKKRHCCIVEMHIFGELEFKDIADSLGVSIRTVEREWRTARAWLISQIEGSKHL